MANIIKVQLPLARFDWVKIWEPEMDTQPNFKTQVPETKPKWSLTCIWDAIEEEKLADVIAQAVAVRDEKWPKGGKEVRSPFRYGIEEILTDAKGKKKKGLRSVDDIGFSKPHNIADYPQYTDKITASISTKRAMPGVVIPRRDPATGKWMTLTDESKLYSGCYGIVTATIYALSIAENPGIRFGLQNIMVMKDGEPFQGGVKAESDFDGLNPEEYGIDNSKELEPDMSDM